MGKKIVLITLMAIVGGVGYVQVRGYWIEKKVLGAATEKKLEISKLETRKEYWKKIVADSPTYRDGYIQLAVINLQLSNIEEVKMYVQKALDVDPNWVVPEELRSLVD